MKQVILLSLVILGLVACQPSAPEVVEEVPVSESLPPDTEGGLETSSMLAGSNALFVNSQMPGDRVEVVTLLLQEPGFVVIYENSGGEAGDEVGRSQLLETDAVAVTVMLERETEDGEELIAMLYRDDGDGEFDPLTDEPFADEVTGEPVSMMFAVSATADEEPQALL